MNEFIHPKLPKLIIDKKTGLVTKQEDFTELTSPEVSGIVADEDDNDTKYFRFYHSYYYAILTLSKENRYLALMAIIEAAFTDIRNEDLPKPVLGILRTIRPFIKAQKKRQIAGMAGKSFGKLGSPYGKKGGRPRKKAMKTE